VKKEKSKKRNGVAGFFIADYAEEAGRARGGGGSGRSSTQRLIGERVPVWSGFLRGAAAQVSAKEQHRAVRDERRNDEFRVMKPEDIEGAVDG
jgi:hypothetical protein